MEEFRYNIVCRVPAVIENYLVTQSLFDYDDKFTMHVIKLSCELGSRYTRNYVDFENVLKFH